MCSIKCGNSGKEEVAALPNTIRPASNIVSIFFISQTAICQNIKGVSIEHTDYGEIISILF